MTVPSDTAKLVEQAREQAKWTLPSPHRAELFAALADAVERLTAERDEARERGQNLVDGIGMEREMRKDAEADRDRLAAALRQIADTRMDYRGIARAALAAVAERDA